VRARDHRVRAGTPSAAAPTAANRLCDRRPLRGTTSARPNRGNVSSAVCDRIPIAMPERKAPPTSALLNSRRCMRGLP
jgi:hypothetical protein